MKIGYARVSTEDQKLDLQIQSLKKEDCKRIFTDHGVSGGSFDRQGLDEALAFLNPGDTLVVWRLDRLGRSLIHLVQLMEKLGRNNIHFHSITEAIDTSSSGGRLVFHMMAALSEFERSLISERTRAGMAAARLGGRQLGRPPILSDEDLRKAIQATAQRGERLEDVAKHYGLAPRALRRMIQSRLRRLSA
ncbi:recombinase family protein [Rhizobium sp. CG5]|uniref:recombinase family protein n=1 Tax=Rhizobium sp. CG5 TaxID=2726076 RepID=UPI002033E17C|nr:recombinase family protein [Rhizobium sp. CG5]MCM2476099.1 recombinase family protein [Rhizobium sp. CG5]